MQKAALFFLVPTAIFGAYPYYYSETPSNPASFASSTGGAQISSVAVPDGSNEYELRATLNIKASGGTFAFYLRASSDALTGPNASGTYYAVELQDIQISGATCTGTLSVYKTVNAAVTLLSQSAEACKDGIGARV